MWNFIEITVLCLLSLAYCEHANTESKYGINATVRINRVPVNTVNERYLSLGMDVNLIRHGWITLNFTSERLKTMAKALSPAYLRVSGTDADRMFFDKDGKIKKKKSQYEINKALRLLREKGELFPFTNFNMTGEDWDLVNIFTQSVGWRVIFGFNLQTRNNSRWDPSNAMTLLDYSIEKGYYRNLDFELGNEPNHYQTRKGQVILNFTQIGNDFVFLRKLLNGPKYGIYYGKSILVGPDVTGSASSNDVTEFLNTAGGVVRGMTWHQYYGSSKTIKNVKDYTNPNILDSYIGVVKNMAKGIHQSSYPNLKSWQGETATVVHPPGNDIAMSYVAGFMLVDKLGLNALYGVELFVRQTFYGFWFTMVDQALYPTPDFWITLIYKKLVGRKVFETDVTINDTEHDKKYARFYAHCTPVSATYPKGAVTVYGMNLFNDHLNIQIDLIPDLEIDQYVLTPGGWGGLTSRFIALNDEILLMPDDHNLPEIKPVNMNSPFLRMPPKSMGFFVIKNYSGLC